MTALIVRAVNSHAALVAALEAVMAEYRDGYGLNCADQCRAALALARQS